MLVRGSLLDDDGGELTRLLAGVGAGLVCALVIALLVPVLVLATLVHSGSGVLLTARPSVNSSASAQLPVPIGVVQAPGTLSAEGRATDVARRYLGVRYIFGGTDP